MATSEKKPVKGKKKAASKVTPKRKPATKKKPEPKSSSKVERKMMPISKLIPADYNPREIDDEALDGLTNNIEKFGLVQEVIVNKRHGMTIVGGHQRIKALLSLKKKEVPVCIVDLSKADEKRLNMSLNNPHIAGRFTDELQELLREVQGDDLELFNDIRLDLLLEPPKPEDIVDPPTPEVPKNPITKLGDIWVLGRHRLICGDSTSKTVVEKLLAGKKPFMMVTDPPYGVDYDPKWRNEADGGNRKNIGKVANDDRMDWTKAWELFTGDVAYVWHADRFASDVFLSLQATKLMVRAQLIWKKGRFALSRGHYHWGHEPCWYSVRKGKTSRWCGDHKQSTVWEIDSNKEDADTIHATQKPVECMARPIRNHGKAGDIVYEPFCGSGSTLIAAEQLDRACYAIELDPGYCDVIVQRFEQFTGEKAKRSKK